MFQTRIVSQNIMALTTWRLLGVAKPAELKAQQHSVSVPLSVRFTPTTVNWELSNGRMRHAQPDGKTIPEELGAMDAWQVRGEFLTAGSEDGMLAFLRRTGVFHVGERSWRVEDLTRFQAIVRYLMTVSPQKWKAPAKIFDQVTLEAVIRYRMFPIEFEWFRRKIQVDKQTAVRRETYQAALVTNVTLGAILATVHIDHLSNAVYDFCSNPACGQQFLKTRRDRKYCRWECAHVVWMREKRAAQKKAL